MTIVSEYIKRASILCFIKLIPSTALQGEIKEENKQAKKVCYIFKNGIVDPGVLVVYKRDYLVNGQQRINYCRVFFESLVVYNIVVFD